MATVPTPDYEQIVGYPDDWNEFGSPSYTPDTFGNDALDADGVNDRLTRSAVHTSSDGDDITIGVWFKSADATSNGFLFEIINQWTNSPGANSKFRVSLRGGATHHGRVDAFAGNSSSDFRRTRTDTRFDDDAWHYIHIRIQLQDVDIFELGAESTYNVDNQLVGTGYSGFTGTAEDLSLGHLADGSGAVEPGVVGSFKIWSQALSDEQIAQDYINETNPSTEETWGFRQTIDSFYRRMLSGRNVQFGR